jgi:hypothetical protein
MMSVPDAQVAREVDASTSEQSGVRQSLAGIIVGEKNRYVRISGPLRCAMPFQRRF